MRRFLPYLLVLLPVAALNLVMFGEALERTLPAVEPPPAADVHAVPRMVVLVFDGVDFDLASEYIRAKELPVLAGLAERGGFRPLLSEIPPESPVALTSMLTGVGPGRHRIFDFVLRGPDNLPENGMVELLRARFLGRVPVRAPRARSRLAVPTFTERVWEAGYPVLSLRQPLLFPVPQRPGARMTAGLGTPDLAGSAGFYAIYSNRLGFEPGYTMFGGYRVPLSGTGALADYATVLYGPQDPTLGRSTSGGNRRASVPLRFERAEEEGVAGVRIHLAGESAFVREGARSETFSVRFPLHTLPVREISGTVRLEVLSLDPLEVMADPVQIDPRDPVFPVSSPEALGRELWARDGSFETMGWQEQTFALNDRVQDDAGFLRDMLQDMDRGEVTLMREMARVRPGSGQTPRLVFYTFTATDRACHGFWRYRDTGHPEHTEDLQLAGEDPIGIVFRRMDAIVGRVLGELAPEDTLLVCSDHGFMTWRWAVKLNQWLVDEGYLVLRSDAETKDLGAFFTGGRGPDVVDWSRTRAFALGLGQIYLNLAERDPEGIVPLADKRALMEELRAKLLALRNPYADASDAAAGIPERAIRSVTILEDVYDYGPGGAPRYAPDLQVGFEKGYRISWQTALLGDMARRGDVFARNHAPWSGDHCSTDRTLVPGVVFSNRKIAAPTEDAPFTVRDIAATVLAHFGIDLDVLHGASRPLPLEAPGSGR